MTRRTRQSGSILPALGFLAATFALVFGTLLPSAVVASAARTGVPIVLCSTEGPRTINPGGEDGDDRLAGLKCASCVLADLTALPPPPPPRPAPMIAATAEQGAPLRSAAPPPPARAPPRPPSTAPPAA